MKTPLLCRFFCVTMLLLAAGGIACRKAPEARSYNEPAAANAPAPAQTPATPAAETASFQAVWNTPRGWREEKGNGFRLASFVPEGSKEGDGLCTLIPLQGEAGGRAANVERWMSQLELPAMTEAELNRFLGGQQELRTAADWPVWVADFTPLAQKANRPRAMMAAIVSAGAYTLFVKLTGTPALLSANRDRFLDLCRSLKPGARP